MTTLRAIVTAANRDLGILAEAEEAPAEMAARGLRLAQGVILEAVTLAGGAWREVDTAADYLAGEDERVRISGAAVVSRPVSIDIASGRGSVLAADTASETRRAPRNFARIQTAGVSGETWIYVAELGAWRRCDGLTLTSESPVGPSGDDGLTAAVAARINRGRGPLDSDIARTAALFRLSIASGRGTARPSVIASWF